MPDLRIDEAERADLVVDSGLNQEQYGSIIPEISWVTDSRFQHLRARELGDQVDISDIFPPGTNQQCNVYIPDGSFLPDQWSRAFLQGLSKLELDGLRGVEIGVGVGINAIYLLRNKGLKDLLASDLEPHLGELSFLNVQSNLHPEEHQGRYFAARGGLDLATWLSAADGVDVVFACIPQVGESSISESGRRKLEQKGGTAHYYDKDKYPSELNAFGLGLNDVLLAQCAGVLKPGGKVILNLAGRPGFETLEQLFAQNGFDHRILHQEVIQQHQGTSLESMALIEEASGREHEFFADQECGHPITAREAEERRKRGISVYHRIYVMEGIKQ